MNLEQGIQLFLKYLPVAIAIYKRESPTIQAFIADFKALQAGQAPSAVVPAVTTTQTVLMAKFPP